MIRFNFSEPPPNYLWRRINSTSKHSLKRISGNWGKDTKLGFIDFIHNMKQIRLSRAREPLTPEMLKSYPGIELGPMEVLNIDDWGWATVMTSDGKVYTIKKEVRESAFEEYWTEL